MLPLIIDHTSVFFVPVWIMENSPDSREVLEKVSMIPRADEMDHYLNLFG
jgi:hypothetical protein